jgi:glycosyltransferase involved in cell wall biosynthesis
MPGQPTPSSSEGSGVTGARRPSGARLDLITWNDDAPTGGNIYNVALVESLRVAGVDARVVRVGAGWPEGSAADRALLRSALSDSSSVLVDGIVAGNAPEEIGAAVASGRRVAVLVHLPLAEEVGLSGAKSRRYLARERATLADAYAILCPSRHTALALAERYGRRDAVVAPPGTDPASVAHGSSPPHLLCLGAITPSKNQLGLLAALARLRHLDWSASIVGSTSASPRYAAAVAAALAAGPGGIGGRVRLTGILTGAALEKVWAATDLLVCTSRVETYGLAVAEALAHGIPAVVPAGTGAVESLGRVDGLPPGRSVDPDGLDDVLHGWLTEPELRDDWRRRALIRRTTLPHWSETAEIVRAAIW